MVLSIPNDRYFLGLHIGHDRAITVSSPEKIVFHTAVERLDRRKHSDSPSIPFQQIDEVLDYLNIGVASIAGVGISYLAVDAAMITKTLEADFRQHYPEFDGQFAAVDHHLAHAIGSKVCSGFNDAMVLVADGAGDQRSWGSQAESVFHVSDGTFYLLEERVQAAPLTYIDRPEFYDPNFFRPDDQFRQISLGLKYEQITYLCGFGPGQAGQTMALAAFGKPLFDYQHLLPKDLSFSLRYADFLNEFNALAASREMTFRQFVRKNRADVASTFQSYLVEAMSRIVKGLVEKYAPDRFCFSGGLFLNCIMNRRLLDDHPDKQLFFFPACHDEGQSIGTAAYAVWRATDALPDVIDKFPYLGRRFDQSECRRALESEGLQFRESSDEDLIVEVSRHISEGRIIGMVRGRSEAGPRALGHRSILADPRNPTSKQRLDEGIKRRAEFRPYAPMMLREDLPKFCDLDNDAPHMLLTAMLNAATIGEFPSITHIDNSTRVQTVSETDDRFLFQLLTDFKEKTGCPMILNTSFNDETEPMVDSPRDALRTFLSTDLDVLVLENCIHVRQG